MHIVYTCSCLSAEHECLNWSLGQLTMDKMTAWLLFAYAVVLFSPDVMY